MYEIPVFPVEFSTVTLRSTMTRFCIFKLFAMWDIDGLPSRFSGNGLSNLNNSWQLWYRIQQNFTCIGQAESATVYLTRAKEKPNLMFFFEKENYKVLYFPTFIVCAVHRFPANCLKTCLVVNGPTELMSTKYLSIRSNSNSLILGPTSLSKN